MDIQGNVPILPPLEHPEIKPVKPVNPQRSSMGKTIFFGATALLLLLVLPITVFYFSQKTQVTEQRSKASGTANVCTVWQGPIPAPDALGTGDIQAQSDVYIENNTKVFQTIWRGNKKWERTIPVVSGVPDWNNTTAFTTDSIITIADYPGSGDIRSQSDILLENNTKILQTLWRGDQGWSRMVPLQSGVPAWSAASVFTGPVSLSSLPGGGTYQAESDILIQNNTKMMQIFWRDNQKWIRIAPIENNLPNWLMMEPPVGPGSITELPGAGTVQAQSDIYIENNTKLFQTIWRNNMKWTRTVPVVSGIPVFSGCPAGDVTTTPTPPVCTSFQTMKINSCSPVTTYESTPRPAVCETESTAVTLNMNATGATQMAFYEMTQNISTTACASIPDSSFSTPVAYNPASPFTLSSGAGQKKVCVRLINPSGSTKCGGMIELVKTASTIHAPPICTSFQNMKINNCTPASAWAASPRPDSCKTSTNAVTLNMNSTISTQMAFYEPTVGIETTDCSSYPDSAFSVPVPYAATSAFTLSSGAGQKKVCVRLINAGGSTKCGGRIELLANSTPPPVCTSFQTMKVNNCTPASAWAASPRPDSCKTSTNAVTLNMNATNATQMAFYEPTVGIETTDCASYPDSAFSAPVPYAATSAFNLSSGAGQKKVCVRLSNAGGSTKCGGRIELLTSPPECTSFQSMKINNCTPVTTYEASPRPDVCKTTSTGVTLNMNPSDATQMAFYEMTENLTTTACNSIPDSAFSTPVSFAVASPFTLSSTTGQKKVCIRLINANGSAKCGGMIELASAQPSTCTTNAECSDRHGSFYTCVSNACASATKTMREDINGDGKVNALDYQILLNNYLKSPITNSMADINEDGAVNSLDYSRLLSKYGAGQ